MGTLMKACEKKDLDKLKRLLESSKNRDTINTLYPWPGDDELKAPVLSFSSCNNTHAFVEVLLNNGARDDIEDSKGNFPIHHACESDEDALAKTKLMVERNSDNVQRLNKCDSPPILFVRSNDVLEYLIHKGADVNQVNAAGDSPLHRAGVWDDSSIVNTMVKYGANVNCSNMDGFTPLHIGAQLGNLESIEAIAASPSCDVNLKTKKGETVLDIAKQKKYKKLDYGPVITFLGDIMSHPISLLGLRLKSINISYDKLKEESNQKDKTQNQQIDELSKNLLDLERQMSQINNETNISDTLSKLNEQIRLLNLEQTNNTRESCAGPSSDTSGKNEYDAGKLAKAIRGCFDKLLKDIHCDDHAPSLFAKRALSHDQYEQINAAVGSKRKVETMLNCLLRKKSPAWAPLFFDSLKNSHSCSKSVVYINAEYSKPSLERENTID